MSYEEKEERKRIALLIDEGSKTEYWACLKKALNEWRADEIRALDGFKRSGIKSEDVATYNRGVDRLELINKFLRINDVLINYNLNWLDKIKDYAEDLKAKAETFLTSATTRFGETQK